MEDQPLRRPRASFGEDFRRFFLRGLATVLPTLITLWLLIKLWSFLWEYLGFPIIRAIYLVGPHVSPWVPVQVPFSIDAPLEDRSDLGFRAEIVGVALAILLVYLLGMLVGNYLGRAAYRLLEVAAMRLPLIRAIYPPVKQVTDFLLADRNRQLGGSRVVAVRPHEDNIWSIGFLTGPGPRALAAAAAQEMVTVFVPSSPTAFSGYVLVVPRDKVVELPLKAEEALRLLVSGGVINPEKQAEVSSGHPGALADPGLTGQPGGKATGHRGSAE